MKTEVATLNSSERSKLRTCEATIQKHLATFVEVGTALAEIRNGQLYRETHKTFDSYVKSKWDFERRHAYRLIEAASVVENVSHGTQNPTSERQVRPLVELPAEKQAEAWETAVEKARESGKPVTAAIVEEVVEEILEQAEPWKCPHCGGTARDEDGDCAKCHEPAIKAGKAKTVKDATGGRKPDKSLAQRKQAAVKALEVLLRRLDDLGLGERFKKGLESVRAAIGDAK